MLVLVQVQWKIILFNKCSHDETEQTIKHWISIRLVKSPFQFYVCDNSSITFITYQSGVDVNNFKNVPRLSSFCLPLPAPKVCVAIVGKVEPASTLNWPFLTEPVACIPVLGYIQKARVPEVQTPQIIFNLWKLSRLHYLQGLYSNLSLIMFKYYFFHEMV